MNWTELIDKAKRYQKWLIIAGVALLALTILAFFLVTTLMPKSPSGLAIPDVGLASSSQMTSESSGQASKQDTKIIVDIKGAVKQPAVYQVSSDARINDVVKLAGGLTDQADLKSVNLSQKVVDEMVIYVGSVGENLTVTTSSAPSSATNSGAATGERRVNLNTADLAELQTLTGVGAKRAQDIIDYREQNGNFKSPDDLKNVSGFGEKTVEKLKDSICVD